MTRLPFKWSYLNFIGSTGWRTFFLINVLVSFCEKRNDYLGYGNNEFDVTMNSTYVYEPANT